MADDRSRTDLLQLTAEIVSAHVSGNAVTPEALPELIRSVYRTLGSVGAPAAPATPERPQPAVPIKRSVFPDHIVCLEDGQKLKTLKRHLATHHGMSVAEYRERWGLPRDYPTVAPNYAEHRSSLARAAGLGIRRDAAAAPPTAPAPEPIPEPSPAAAPKKRGRPAKARAGAEA